jgi:hypothetical protein
MANIRMPFLGLVAAVIALLVLHVEAAGDALTLTYCSSQNTGSDQDASEYLAMRTSLLRDRHVHTDQCNRVLDMAIQRMVL